MDKINPNYFTCTLGEAARFKGRVKTVKSFETVIDLIDKQGKQRPESLALGFALFDNGSPASKCRCLLSFRELANLSACAAETLSAQLEQSSRNYMASTVGLLCTSSVDFVLTWLGLMRLGYSVLLLAPQLEPQAIQHLCSTLGVTAIFVDDSHEHRTAGIGDDFQILRIPSYREDGSEATRNPRRNYKLPKIPYIFHTSGTSSGLPKPIPQSNFGAVETLPCFPSENKPAAFSTTPVYHGGLADCLRAWTSDAMIWFFPERHAPITGANLLKAIECSRDQSSVPVSYFSSVPYVLQMLSEEDGGIQALQTMDLVGVGGAALPTAVGDKLVNAGYLRAIDDTELLSFEPRENGLSELVVKPGWPFKVKTNRQGGSYATSDLFEPHPSKPNSWRYHSRADAQIALANGKKFDPSPLEGAMLSSTKMLRDVLIFGTGRDYAGALLFPTSKDVSERKLIETIWPLIENMNSESQNHARISKAMLLVIPGREGESSPLEKSSKGTILRRQAEERYAREIDSAYNQRNSTTYGREITNDQLQAQVADRFLRVLGHKLDPDQDLYRQDVDSIACIQIRKLIESSCLPQQDEPLPMNVIYDRGTITALMAYLQKIREGSKACVCVGEEGDAQLHLMRQLAEKYGTFPNMNPMPRVHGKAVVLTGATGFLGSHILHNLRQDARFERVFCLLRAQDTFAAQKRVSEALTKHGMPGLGKSGEAPMQDDKVVCLSCDLFNQDLGLSEGTRRRILDEAAVVIHSAWTVNFNLRLESFEDQIAGTRNLINMTAECGARFVFVSSTAAVSSSTAAIVPEMVSRDSSEASSLGYSRSKWVAEQICDAANVYAKSSGGSKSQAGSVVRVGQLCSNNAGIWNATEAYPLLLSTAKVASCLPDIPPEALSWLPVDVAAQAVLEVAYTTKSDGKCSHLEPTTPVYHVLNPHNSPPGSKCCNGYQGTKVVGLR
ncbi:hypothetical protein ACJZ2D_006758 [Fusarium nematophilum]